MDNITYRDRESSMDNFRILLVNNLSNKNKLSLTKFS